MNAPTHSPRVLVGVDASDESDVALHEAVRTMARLPGAELHLVHAAAAQATTPAVGHDGHVITSGEEYAKYLRELPQQLWAKLQRIAQTQDVLPTAREIDIHIRTGSAGPVILDMADELGVDLIIVGCHGRTGVKRMLLGSVAEEVVRKAHCPVLVARPGGYERRQERPDPPRTDTTPLHNLQSQTPSEGFSFHTREHMEWTRDNPDTAGPIR